jgi:hypothetical protein
MVTAVKTKKRARRWGLWCALPLVGVAGACWPDPLPLDGTCRIVPEETVDCRAKGYGDELQSANLVGYACSGAARPDHGATGLEGVPIGLLCADKGPISDTGEEAYCCTEDTVTCAFDPAGECEPGDAAYQCWGNNRPESLNPTLLCSNGTSERGLYHYCCTGQPKPPACEESSAVGCGERLLGFRCEGDTLPRGENYGANRSRADSYYPVCTVAQLAPNPKYKTYCCYMTLPEPQGGTCHRQPSVPGCEPGRFGFACYGPDTPEDNYPPIDCPDPGFSGRSAEGYEATLYCCDFT